MTGPDTQRIRELNDRARQTFTGCRVLVTPGVHALDQTPDILALVQRFDGFTPDNDPYGEHDFGSFRFRGETIFWKFDYYDLDCQSAFKTDPFSASKIDPPFASSR